MLNAAMPGASLHDQPKCGVTVCKAAAMGDLRNVPGQCPEGAAPGALPTRRRLRRIVTPPGPGLPVPLSGRAGCAQPELARATCQAKAQRSDRGRVASVPTGTGTVPGWQPLARRSVLRTEWLGSSFLT